MRRRGIREAKSVTCKRTAELKAKARAFLERAPEVRFVDAFLADLNGVLRGKRLPAGGAMKLFETGLRLPRSLVGVDIWGADVFDNGLVLETGDSDGLCAAVAGGLLPAPRTDPPTAQVLMMMGEADGAPFAADPRQALVSLAEQFAAKGLTPVAAFEMEFYLLSKDSDERGRPLTPPSSFGGQRVFDGRVYAMNELDAFGAFFARLYEVCDAQGLPLDTAIAEAGPGQFEVNLNHQADPVRAADEAILLRRAIKGVAASFDWLATFMAKPFGELPGNGMHVHLSLVDEKGANSFDDGTAEGAPLLRHAVAGLIRTAPEAMIFFAPHLNSMRRFQEGSHAPTRAGWGYENRTAAIRIPNDIGANRRFEHRVAGADANPYLVLAALLAGALHGIERRLEAPAPIDGNAYAAEAPVLPTDWRGALAAFEAGEVLAPAFGALFTRVFAALKHQEMRVAAQRVTDFEYQSYLETF
jgi:glutamine synthetase